MKVPSVAKKIHHVAFAKEGFSLTELMVVLVIIGVLVLLALPKLLPIVTKAKTTEAKLMLKQLHTLEQSYKFEHGKYSNVLSEVGFEQEKLVSQGGQARYKIEVVSADEKGFQAQATSVVATLLILFRGSKAAGR